MLRSPHLISPSNGQIKSELIAAYLATDYCVEGPFPAGFTAPFILRIGETSAPLLALYKVLKLECAAFVTAQNPRSTVLPMADNERRHQFLLLALQGKGLTTIEGHGRDPDQQWVAERSLLVLGVSLEEARGLGQDAEQNAVVWCDADAVPRLVLLR
jgi:hypothetical protein